MTELPGGPVPAGRVIAVTFDRRSRRPAWGSPDRPSAEGGVRAGGAVLDGTALALTPAGAAIARLRETCGSKDLVRTVLKRGSAPALVPAS